jgi:hypothetical protein
MYALYLNMMRDRAERMDLLATSEDLQRLQDYVHNELVQPYDDEGPGGFFNGTQTFHKVYRKGGPLEWYNPPAGLGLENFTSFTGGIRKIPNRQEYMEQAGREWDSLMARTVRV